RLFLRRRGRAGVVVVGAAGAHERPAVEGRGPFVGADARGDGAAERAAPRRAHHARQESADRGDGRRPAAPRRAPPQPAGGASAVRPARAIRFVLDIVDVVIWLDRGHPLPRLALLTW